MNTTAFSSTSTPFILALWVLNSFVSLAQHDIYHRPFPKPEKKVERLVSLESKYQVVHKDTIHYYEKGKGDVFLFLHGIPTSSYLWRNVIHHMPDNKRCIALDFPGYGKSSMPYNNDFSFLHQANIIGTFLDSLNIDKIHIVVNDIGSMFGLYYAMQNESRISSIILLEAVILPSEEFYQHVPWIQKRLFALVQKSEQAKEKWLIERDFLLRKSMRMLTKRRLSHSALQPYIAPFEDKNRRRTLKNGTGPTTFTNKGKSSQVGDELDLQNWYTHRLTQTNIPILLLYAHPGWLIDKHTVQYARKNFKNYSEAFLGKGKHFVQEDQPTRIAMEINQWYARQFPISGSTPFDLNRIDNAHASHRKIHTEITIQAPIQEVWKIMTDFSKTAEWSSYFKGIEGTFKSGQNIRVLYSLHPKNSSIRRYKKKSILVDSSLYRFGWKDQKILPGLRDDHTYSLFPISPNETKLIHTDALKGCTARWMGHTIASIFFQMPRTYNQELKKEVEKFLEP
jgi:haloalkane dehalogenase